MSIIQDSLQGNPLQFAVTNFKNFVWNNTLSGVNGAAAASHYFPLSSNKFYLQQYCFRIGATVVSANYPYIFLSYLYST
jgi:hypothetical protein